MTGIICKQDKYVTKFEKVKIKLTIHHYSKILKIIQLIIIGMLLG